MSNTVKVYDLNGEMFEMSHANAADAVAHLGWSKNPPQSEKADKVEAPAVKVKEEATVKEASSPKAEKSNSRE